VYTGGEEFAGKVDPTQKWKLGEIKPEPELPIATKGVTNATQTKKAKAKTEEIDPLDEGEETE
jgi:hypothetical protein